SPSLFRAEPGEQDRWCESTVREPTRSLHVGRRLEAANRISLVVVGLEHCEQLGDGQQIRNPLGQAEELEAAALTTDRREGTNNFSQAGAVDVRNVRQIQDELFSTLQHQAVDLVLESLVSLAQSHLAFEVQDGYITGGSFLDLHSSSNVLPVERTDLDRKSVV